MIISMLCVFWEHQKICAETWVFVLGQPRDSLHTPTSDIYRLQTETAVTSHPPYIRRLFWAACVSVRVRARSVAEAESHMVLTEHVLAHRSSSPSLSFNSSYFDLPWKRGAWMQVKAPHIDVFRWFCVLKSLPLAECSHLLEIACPRAERLERAHWPEINKRALISGEVTMATGELILSCLS